MGARHKVTMEILDFVGFKNIKGEVVLYITPPKEKDVIDRYFALGINRISCSLEIWDDNLAMEITPGKRAITTKQRHLDALTYIVEKYGPGNALSNFIIGLEPLGSLIEGATYMAERGIIPVASVWMPFGKPVMNSVKTPDVEYYRAIKDAFGNLYTKYSLEPAGGSGLNVCVDKDIWNLYFHL